MRLDRRHSPFARGLSAFLVTLIAAPPSLAIAAQGAEETPINSPDVGPDIGPDMGGDVAPPAADTLDPALPPDDIVPVEAGPMVQGGVDAVPVDPGVIALVPGGEKSGATPQAISLPKAEGSIEGMGESFAPDLTSGAAKLTVPIVLPPGRAGVAPTLALTYSSTGGSSVAGMGWSLEVPFVARQSDRGMPRYLDASAWHAEEDRFFYNGGQELVPVDTAAAELVDCGAAGCAPVPDELLGWQQYRARVEGAFLRFFRAPDSLSWVVHGKDGTRFDFGLLSVGDGPAEAQTASLSALQSELPSGNGRIYRWLLTRMTDPHGSTVYYVHDEEGGQRYLDSVFYVSPHAACGALPSAEDRMRCDAPLADYGRRVRLVYEDRPDPLTSYVSSWQIATTRRIKRIEITAASAPGARTLVRRYHFGYAADLFHSILTSLQVEGRPESPDPGHGAMVGDDGIAESSLGDATVGALLPPMRFTYTEQPGTGSQAPGFGGIDATIHNAPASPPHSLDDARAELFDVNSDGLPDLIVTNPALYPSPDGSPGVGVFWNGFQGAATTPADEAGTFSQATAMPYLDELSAVLTLTNLNIVPMDIDGDGRGDLLHMPRLATYGYFTPTRNDDPVSVSPADQGWRWTHVPRAVPPGETDPRIDLGADSDHIKAFDVNNDHLIDVIRTTGTEIQTWLNLGWLPDGDGRFGTAIYDPVSATWQLSTEPIATCLPVSGTPLDFADPEVRIGDMNGDGLQDIVRMRAGRVIYWPGRGEGAWGQGSADCPPGLVSGREVDMATPPAEINVELDGVHLADVNADGADDIVQVRFSHVDVWFNRAGASFTGRIQRSGTPFAPAFSGNVRLVDVDGSGTVDVLYGVADNWRWLDLMGGQRPRLLSVVDGGRGATTSLSYGSSAEDYLADLRDADTCPSCTERFTWIALPGDLGSCDLKLLEATGECVQRSGGSPVISTVVTEAATTDRFNVLGREENRVVARYRYHDGYYEGIEQEFRGFGAADVTVVGDGNSPTSHVRTYVHQGRRAQEIATERLTENPDEALKGLAFLSEAYDDGGSYVGSTHTTYALRVLHAGLNGMFVVHAVGVQTDELRYDNAFFAPLGDLLVLPHVIRGIDTEPREVVIRGDGYAHLRATVDDLDGVGNILEETKHGRIRGEFGETLGDETIQAHGTFENLDGSLTGWLWRPIRTFVSGHGDTTPLADTTIDYNASGDAMVSTTDVNQSATYVFGGDGTALDLGSPDPQDVILANAYDAWGGVTASCGGGDAETGAACLRYRQVQYEEPYALFPVEESVAVRRNGGGFDALQTDAAWDSGLGVATLVTDPNGEPTSVTYDAFGRLTSLTAPPVLGCDGSLPSALIGYDLPANPATRPVSLVTSTTYLSCLDPGSTIATVALVDGLGRTRAQLSTGDGTPGQEWIQGGVVTFDAKGATRLAYQDAFHGDDPSDIASAVSVPGVPFTATAYDAFGRMVEFVDAGGARTSTFHHALSVDVWDPLDLQAGGPFAGTPTTARQDGHGRTIDQVLRNIQPNASGIEVYRLFTTYRADGAVLRVERGQTAGDAVDAALVGGHRVVRAFVYDTVARRIGTTDPDTDNRVTGDTWRYLFNRVGDLVAVRDPRGCGQNFFYDHAGRLVGEQYVSCAEAASPDGPAGQVPSGAVGFTETDAAAEVDVRLHYDTYAGSWVAGVSFEQAPVIAGGVLGRLTATSDRGQRSAVAYDFRGNPVWEARQVVIATGDSPSGVVYDTAHTYERLSAHDHGNRVRGIVLPRDPDFDAGPGPVIAGTLTFGARGLPTAADTAFADGAGPVDMADGVLTLPGVVATQPVITALAYDRDGLLLETTYGDDVGATRPATVSVTGYDARRRSTHLTTTREPTCTPLGMGRPLCGVSVAFDQFLTWDDAANLTRIDDQRPGNEWEDGHRPASFTLIGHDALYRVTGAEFGYIQDDGSVTAQDEATDWRNDVAATRPNDPMRMEPAPMLPALPPDRVASLQWQYDWLGNAVLWEDDAHSFYERSIGAITNGADLSAGLGETPALRSSALYLASDLAGTPADRGGYVEVDYGVSGNVVEMTVHARCKDKNPGTCADPGGEDLAARRAALAATCKCAKEQRYEYFWDEVNRLAEARRSDRGAGGGGPGGGGPGGGGPGGGGPGGGGGGGGGSYQLQVTQVYRYDGGNQRTTKTTIDDGTPTARVALYVFPGDFERRGLVVNEPNATYTVDAALETETQYLVAGARIVWKSTTPMTGLDRDHRITVPITDILGTSAGVIDLRTGELVEHSTYYPNGARETYVTDEALFAPEPMGFTSKEADEEVGLIYFGERYLIPRLGRWASPDPLTIHALGGGEAMNSYHYVSGSLLQARDPLGLDPNGEQNDSPETVAETKRIVSQGHGKREAERVYQSQAYADFLNGMLEQGSLGILLYFRANHRIIGVSQAEMDKYQVMGHSGGFGSYATPHLHDDPVATQAYNDELARLEGRGAKYDTLLLVVAIGAAALGGVITIRSMRTPRGTAARVRADAAQAAGRESGVAAELRVGDKVFTDVSIGKGATTRVPALHPDVQAILDEIPLLRQSKYHGGCAEPGNCSQALEAGVNPRGGVSTAVKIRRRGHAAHGTRIEPCESCEYLLKALGIDF